MGCLLWIQNLIDILPLFLFVQCLTVLDGVITALDVIYLYDLLIHYTWIDTEQQFNNTYRVHFPNDKSQDPIR